jgi:adenylate kinase
MGSSRYAVTLLIGAPGAGKGTQARFICEALGIPHVATGDLLREHRRHGTTLGAIVRRYMDRGELVPDELVVEMVARRLEAPDAVHGVLLDGFPRTRAQARALDADLAHRGGGVERVFILDVPTPALVDRLVGRRICECCHGTFNLHIDDIGPDLECPECGGPLVRRPDDQRDVVERRVGVYLRETAPVVEHYRAAGVLHRVNGDRPIDEIWGDVQTLLEDAWPVVLVAS